MLKTLKYNIYTILCHYIIATLSLVSFQRFDIFNIISEIWMFLVKMHVLF